MRTLNHIYCCLYYYGKETAETVPLLLAVLMGAFVIHKLVSWSLWVMSL